MKEALIVGLGGFVGTVCRYIASISMTRLLDAQSYWATLLVNLLGCFIIGLIAGGTSRQSSLTILFLMVGICGGFTTFSSFAMDGLKLLKSGAFVPFILYSGASVLGGLLLCYAGFQLLYKE